MLRGDEHIVNQSCPRIYNVSHLSIFNTNISADAVRKNLESGPFVVFPGDKNKDEPILFFNPRCHRLGVQLHDANSDFQDCFTLNTLYYVCHDRISFHLLVSSSNQLAKLYCAHANC